LTRLKEWYQSLNRPPGELLEQEIIHNWRKEEVVKNV